MFRSFPEVWSAVCGSPLVRVSVVLVCSAGSVNAKERRAASGAGASAPVGKTVQYGTASWHAPSGGADSRTASGRRWVGEEMVAAHRSLPLGSRVKVVNVKNGKETVVQITDRGPHGRGRIIDLSRAAARELDLLAAGTGPVRVELLTTTTAGTIN